jgi:uncharacterized membrane protein YidH (DUF202 family)
VEKNFSGLLGLELALLAMGLLCLSIWQRQRQRQNVARKPNPAVRVGGIVFCFGAVTVGVYVLVTLF